MRWIFLLLTVICAFIPFNTDSPGLMGLGMLGALLFAFLAVITFAQARIESSSQSQATLLTSRDVQVLRQQTVQKKVAQSRSAASAQPMSGTSAGDD